MANEFYTVERKEEIRRLNPKTMEAYIAYRTWATSQGGTYFSVDIPEEDLDKAKAILTKKAKLLDSI